MYHNQNGISSRFSRQNSSKHFFLLNCLPEHDDEGVGAGEGEEDERQHRRRAAVEDGGADRDEGGGGAVAAALSCSGKCR